MSGSHLIMSTPPVTVRPTPVCTDDLRYLQMALQRIDLLLQREVRRWEVAGQDPNDDYRGLYVTQAEAGALLDLPFGVSWGQSISLPPEEEAAFAAALTNAEQTLDELSRTLTSEGKPPRLLQLATTFGLDQTALDIFLLCAAPAFATRYERIYGYLQDNVTRRRPTVRLVLQLLGEPGIGQYALAPYLQADAPLLHHRLLELITEAPPANVYWINQTLQVDEGVIAWLRGVYQPPVELQSQATLLTPVVGETERLLAGETLQRIREAADLFPVHDAAFVAPMIVLYGIDQVAQVAVAHCLAGEGGQQLLTVHLARVIGESCPARRAVQLALREARLTGATLLLTGWESCLDEEKRVDGALLADLCDHPGMVLLAGRQRWQSGALTRRRRLLWYELAAPDYPQRCRLWSHFVAAVTTGRDAMPDMAATLAQLAGQFTLTSGQIQEAVTLAADQVQQAGRALTGADLFVAARACSQSRLDALAAKITPRYGWADLILPADQIAMLHELVSTVRGRDQVLGAWGLGQKLAASRGVSALFAGPPGTGKTMAAEVIAGALGYDLYKIDLATVVSKYIGETEKNLERIFSEATSSNAILFFDEADALFGKRSEVKEAHDRYANIEISYLLQRMERYDGVAILASNLRGHLDEAFTRRLHFIVAFPFPQKGERYRIWQALFPPEVPRAEDLDGEFKRLAERFELTGANIRNVIYSAANLAAGNGQVVTKEHLRHGVKRELQKMGKTVSVGDF
ncbi:MAG: ATP-binding protein [Caldilinea sp. CFX5]|nr:ATP-binding protein [Caldilinea sp. CFX5]